MRLDATKTVDVVASFRSTGLRQGGGGLEGGAWEVGEHLRGFLSPNVSPGGCLVVRWGEWMTISMHLLRTFEVADSCSSAAGEKSDDAEALRSEAAWRMSEMAWA